jgi:hypothetical protein
VLVHRKVVASDDKKGTLPMQGFNHPDFRRRTASCKQERQRLHPVNLGVREFNKIGNSHGEVVSVVFNLFI